MGKIFDIRDYEINQSNIKILLIVLYSCKNKFIIVLYYHKFIINGEVNLEI